VCSSDLLERARRDPARIKLIDSTRPIDVIQQELATLLQELL
jgi:thymidylate kinase